MVTKHDLTLEYTESLPVGNWISVRSIARELNINEGTAYRTIKDAENVELVPTIQRVDTIRIERKLKKHIERLASDEVVRIVGEDVSGGLTGLGKVLDKFVIGATTKHAMERHTTPGSLIIVGNRAKIQKLVLEDGVAVLVTGGLNTITEIVKLADEPEVPISYISYDIFTVVTMINRALSSQLIKKDIMLVSDVYVSAEKTHYLYQMDAVSDCQRLSEETQHSRFPVANYHHRLTKIVTTEDVLGESPNQITNRVMTKEPISVKETMSIASANHQMIWDGSEVMPIVSDNLTLEGLITRRDVTKAMWLVQRRP